MVLALNPGPQFAAITGNPAGLLLWRIWYSVGKSGVLGITEYRQDRPLQHPQNWSLLMQEITFLRCLKVSKMAVIILNIIKYVF